MKKSRKIPYFEVDFKQRLEQSQTATNAVRLPRLGFQQYRVYDIVEVKDKIILNNLYGQYLRPGGLKKGPLTLVGSNFSNVQRWKIFIDELYDTHYKVKWLKPKHVTFLQLKGHRVEEVNKP